MSSVNKLRQILEETFPNASGEEISALFDLFVLAALSIEEETD